MCSLALKQLDIACGLEGLNRACYLQSTYCETQLNSVVLARHGRRVIFLLAYTPNFNVFRAGVEVVVRVESKSETVMLLKKELVFSRVFFWWWRLWSLKWNYRKISFVFGERMKLKNKTSHLLIKILIFECMVMQVLFKNNLNLYEITAARKKNTQK